MTTRTREMEMVHLYEQPQMRMLRVHLVGIVGGMYVVYVFASDVQLLLPPPPPPPPSNHDTTREKKDDDDGDDYNMCVCCEG